MDGIDLDLVGLFLLISGATSFACPLLEVGLLAFMDALEEMSL